MEMLLIIKGIILDVYALIVIVNWILISLKIKNGARSYYRYFKYKKEE